MVFFFIFEKIEDLLAGFLDTSKIFFKLSNLFLKKFF